MTTVELGTVAKIVSGATPKTGVPAYWGGEVNWATPADLSRIQEPYISTTPRTLTQAGLDSCGSTILPVDSVLLSSRAPIGHVAINSVPMATNQGFKSLIPGPLLNSKFLYHWLKCNTELLQSLGNGVTFKELSKRAAEQIRIPLPPLPEQRRIAAILDHADALRAKRRQVLAHLDSLTHSIFEDMFGSHESQVTLGEIATIQGGLQVSAKRASLPLEVSYLRVANAHRNRLELKTIKTLKATRAEIERTRLLHGDLLFVEGHANPLEVGRVALWSGQIRDCVHQNHLIRARLDSSHALPMFVSRWLNTERGAAHFRRAGKTTSGLNTITASTVRSAPLPLPPMALQDRFVERNEHIAATATVLGQAMSSDAQLFASLKSRAFRGEL